jgi:hypothetical protein
MASEAGNPTLYIDGIAVGLTQGGPGCGNDTGFKNGSNSVLNSCYSINGANVTAEGARSSTIRIGNWYVGSIASTNVARVLINDTATGRDDMKLSGVTFTRADVTSSNTTTVSATFPCSACKQGHAVLVNVFNNAPNGTGTGTDYLWAMTESGNYDPPSTENVLNNRFRLIGTGCFATSCSTSPTATTFTVNLGTPLDTGIFISSTSTNVTTGISKSNSSSTVKAGCNTGNGKCAPTLRYDYEITVQGIDTLKVTDSVDGCGGQCDPNGPTNKLPGCTDTIASDGSTIPGLKTICDKQVGVYVAAHADALAADNGVVAETCEGTCIVIEIEGTPANRAAGTTFNFCAGGQGVRLPYSLPCDDVTFSRTLDAQGNAVKGFSNLAPDSNPNVGDPNDRFFTIPVYPPGGSKGTWETDQINCSSSFNNGTASWIVGTAGNNSAQKISLTVLTIAQGDILTCSWHVH